MDKKNFQEVKRSNYYELIGLYSWVIIMFFSLLFVLSVLARRN